MHTQYMISESHIKTCKKVNICITHRDQPILSVELSAPELTGVFSESIVLLAEASEA